MGLFTLVLPMNIFKHGNGFNMLIYRKMFTHGKLDLYYGHSRQAINSLVCLNYNNTGCKNKQYYLVGTYSNHKVRLYLSHEKKSILTCPLPILGTIHIEGNLIANIQVDLIAPGQYSLISLINGRVISLEKSYPNEIISTMFIKLDGKNILEIFTPRKNNDLKTSIETFKEFFLAKLGRVASFKNYSEFLTLNIEEQICIISMLPLYEFFIRKRFNESEIAPP